MTPEQKAEVVDQFGPIFARFNNQRYLIKPQQSLPSPWYATREAFLHCTKELFHHLTKEQLNSLHQMYAELAFFVDNNVYAKYSTSFDIAVKSRLKRLKSHNMDEEESDARMCLAGHGIKIQSKKEIYHNLEGENIPPKDLMIITETLTYCSSLYKLMYDEWVALANFVSFQNRLTR